MTSPRRKKIKWERWCKRCLTWGSMNADIWRHIKRGYVLDGRTLAQKKWRAHCAISALNCSVVIPAKHFSDKWKEPVRVCNEPDKLIAKLDMIANLVKALTFTESKDEHSSSREGF